MYSPSSNTPQENTFWHLDQQNDGSWRIYNQDQASSDLRLYIRANGITPFFHTTSELSGNFGQFWTLKSFDDGSFQMYNAEYQKCLHINGKNNSE